MSSQTTKWHLSLNQRIDSVYFPLSFISQHGSFMIANVYSIYKVCKSIKWISSVCLSSRLSCTVTGELWERLMNTFYIPCSVFEHLFSVTAGCGTCWASGGRFTANPNSFDSFDVFLSLRVFYQSAWHLFRLLSCFIVLDEQNSILFSQNKSSHLQSYNDQKFMIISFYIKFVWILVSWYFNLLVCQISI